MQIKDSVCIITGGASGLGRGTVETLLQLGMRIAVFDVNAIPDELTERGVAFFRVDVTNDAMVKEAVEGVYQQFGAIHACVNCAGIVKSAPTYGDDGIFPVDLFRRIVDVNLTGSFIVMARAVEKIAMNKPDADGERGVIVNTASIAGLDGSSSIAYAASKGGVVAMSLTAARDLAKYGIRINAIAPGFMDTEMFAGLPADYTAKLITNTVFPKRLGKASEFGRLTAHLIENSFINATVVRLDSGTRN